MKIQDRARSLTNSAEIRFPARLYGDGAPGSPQHDQGSESTGLFFGPIGVKEVGSAARADVGTFDVSIPESDSLQLAATDFPQVEVIGFDHRGPEIIRENLFV